MDLGIADYGFALQTAKGSPASSATYRVPAAGGSLEPVTEYASLELVTPNVQTPQGYVARQSARGDVIFFPRPSPIGLLLYGALGAKSVSGASDPWTHVFTPAIAKPWLTFWRGVGGTLFERFADCKISRLTLGSRAGEPLRVAASVIGITPRWRTSGQSATIDTSIPFLHADGAAALTLNGTVSRAVDDWQLVIETGSHLDDLIDGVTVADGPTTMTLHVGRVSPDTGFYAGQHYANTTPADNTDAPYTATAFTGIDFTFAKSASRSIRIEISRAELIAVPGLQPDAGHARARDDLTFRVYDGGVTPVCRATLKNAVASY